MPEKIEKLEEDAFFEDDIFSWRIETAS